MPGTGNTIVITGASGQYAGIVIHNLLEKGIPPSSITLLTRSPNKLAAYTSKGFLVRKGCFDDPVSQLADALAGSKTMLMISTSRAGQRLPQHQTAIDAALQAGVTHIVYTSILSADLDNPTALVGKEHKATEQMLRSSGLSWTALRDAQYAEALTDVAGPPTFTTGIMKVNAGNGRVAFVSRNDCAMAAAAVLVEPSLHRNKTYDITGPDLLSWADAARIMGEMVGKQIEYQAITDDEQLAIFDEMGIPRHPVDGLVVNDVPWNSLDMVSFTKATRLGELAILSNDCQNLTGMAPKSFRKVCEERVTNLRVQTTKGFGIQGERLVPTADAPVTVQSA